MSTTTRCPECNGTIVSDSGGGRRRCSQCGATLAYRLRWVPLLLGAFALSLLFGLGSALLFDGKAAFMIGPLAVMGILFLGRRFRRLQKV